MTHVHEDRWRISHTGQRRHLQESPARLDKSLRKPDVLALACVGIAQALGCHRAAPRERPKVRAPAPRVGADSPCTASSHESAFFHKVGELMLEHRQVGLALREGRELLPKPRVRVEVVIVPVHHDVLFALLDSNVALLADSVLSVHRDVLKLDRP